MTVDARLGKLEKETQRLNTLVLGARRAGAGGVPHNILSIMHPDTDPAALIRGDILAVDASPDLARVAIGVAGRYLRSDGVDPSWAVFQVGDLPAHKDTHDPEDGSDPLDCAAPSELVGVQAAAEGSAHEFARSDHVHQIQHGILDNHLVTIDHAGVVDNDYAKFTADGLEGRSYSEVLSDLSAQALAAFSWNAQNLTNVGDITAGHLALGGAAVDPDMGINFDDVLTDTDNTQKIGVHSNLQVAKTIAAMTGSAMSVYGVCVLDSTNTQNWTHICGLRGHYGRIETEVGSAGTITGAANFYAYSAVENAATITNLYGFYVSTPVVTGNKVTNEYGIYIATQNTGAVLNYAIYTNVGLVRFGDATSIIKSTNADIGFSVFNPNVGANSRASLTLNSENVIGKFAAFSSGIAAPYANTAMIYTSGVHTLFFGTSGLRRMGIDSSGYISLYVIRSGATQVGAGAAANELWKTASHATLPDNVIMIGV